MSRKDPLALIEAVYSFEVDERAWLRGVVEAARPYDLGRGIGGYVAEVGTSVGARSAVCENLEQFNDETLAVICRMLPAGMWRRLNAPGPARLNYDAAVDAARAEGIPLDQLGWLLGTGALLWGAYGGDPHAETALLCLGCREASDLRPADRAVLDAVAAHLGAALRLRGVVGRRPTGQDAATEAVLSSNGRVLDARGAEAQGALGPLIEGVKRSERARSRRADPEERLALWTALIEARWSIVESIESDGKRLLLACRNEPRSAALRQLDRRERSVLQYAALGHTYKYIGYELGLSVSMVAATLKRGLRKLGMASRTELIRSFGGLAADGEAGPVGEDSQ